MIYGIVVELDEDEGGGRDFYALRASNRDEAEEFASETFAGDNWEVVENFEELLSFQYDNLAKLGTI